MDLPKHRRVISCENVDVLAKNTHRAIDGMEIVGFRTTGRIVLDARKLQQPREAEKIEI